MIFEYVYPNSKKIELPIMGIEFSSIYNCCAPLPLGFHNEDKMGKAAKEAAT